MIESKVLECIIGLMEEDLKAPGIMASRMVKVCIYLQMGILNMEFGNKGKE